MRHLALAFLIVLAGCSKGDPETSRLGSGRFALVVRKSGQPDVVGLGSGIPLMQPLDPDDDGPIDWPRLEPGTKLLVMKDEGKGEDNPSRLVDVRVEDGRHQGQVGKFVRGCLRPVE